MNIVLLYLLLLKGTVTAFAGLASLPVIQDSLVTQYHVLTNDQLNDAVVITRSSPGPVGLYVVSVGYFVAGWFLSRAYIMTLFIYGGMVQVIYSMALASKMAPPRMKAFKVIQYSALGSVGLIFVVYIMLRLQHLTSH